MGEGDVSVRMTAMQMAIDIQKGGYAGSKTIFELANQIAEFILLGELPMSVQAALKEVA